MNFFALYLLKLDKKIKKSKQHVSILQFILG
jgi:hypothetical protein